LPQVTDSQVDGVVRNGVVRNRLMRVMVGHLLLLSSAGDSAWGRPVAWELILLGLERGEMDAAVVRQTLCGAWDTGQTVFAAGTYGSTIAPM